ncbi:GGDEF domain-containing protein [Alteromonas sp. PRIM-21]|uniref:GGDEF domain-containing protein n=1 Tax=Alteromonas sp. PRIM-21 TaxID=1454978 RepID=UPI0022B9B574|nr:GGDEF domain-containing protein [Alteromonas sp. PRIM-21]MCZ8530479.1 GGDEF domain-containing protein [Alteromonas sp. PRIM-21]
MTLKLLIISPVKLVTYSILAVLFSLTSSLSFAAETGNSILEEAYKIRSSNPKKSRELFKSLDKASLSEDDKELYDFTAAYMELVAGDLLSASEAYRQIAEGDYSFRYQFQSYAALAAINAATQNWAEAFSAMDFLTENIDRVTDPLVKEQAHNAIINFYSSIDEKETVISYGNSLISGQHSPRFTCFLHMQLIVALVSTQSDSLSEDSFTKALNYCESAEEKIALIAIYTHYATYLYNKNEIEASLAVLNEHLSEVESTKYPPLLEEYYALLSKIYFLREEYEKAQEYAYKVLGEEEDTGYAVISDIDAYEVLYQIAEKQQNYEKALQLHKDYAKARSLNLSSMSNKMLSIHKAQQDSLIKSNQITLLDAENSLLKAKAQLAQEESNIRRLIYLVLFMAFLVTAFWLYKKRSHYIALEKISQRDGLTGIANRTYFTKISAELIKYADQHGKPVSLIIFDLDDFKKINDTYGHQVGDQALQSAVTAALKGCRPDDYIGRLGGEEFGIILPNCDLEHAMTVAQRCRKQIELTNQSGSQQFKLTASFGVASAPKVAYDFEALFENADKALYQSKNSGKNRVNI